MRSLWFSYDTIPGIHIFQNLLFSHRVFHSYSLFSLGLSVSHILTGLWLADISLPSILCPFIPGGYHSVIYDAILVATLWRHSYSYGIFPLILHFSGKLFTLTEKCFAYIFISIFWAEFVGIHSTNLTVLHLIKFTFLRS